jgi:protein translocase SecG subunit
LKREISLEKKKKKVKYREEINLLRNIHMKEYLMIIELVLSILLGITILLQPKSSGMGSMAGEDTENFSTKRGAEKFLHNATMVLAFLFGVVAVIYPFF